MGEIWTLLVIVGVAVLVFLLLRWTATRRAIGRAHRKRESR